MLHHPAAHDRRFGLRFVGSLSAAHDDLCLRILLHDVHRHNQPIFEILRWLVAAQTAAEHTQDIYRLLYLRPCTGHNHALYPDKRAQPNEKQHMSDAHEPFADALFDTGLCITPCKKLAHQCRTNA